MMKAIYIFIVMLLFILIMCSKSYSQDNPLILKGPYMGQKLPGSIAEVFAPGIVSTEHYEIFGLFAPGMKEFYFVRGGKDKKQQLIVYKSQKNKWNESVVGPRLGEPFITPDGMIMYLGNKYMERKGTGWSEVKSLGSPYEDMPIMRLTVSSRGTYVFDEATRDGEGVLRYSILIDGKREKPKALSKEINTGKWNAHPFIAPDESYIIFDAEREGGYGNSDLYISFRQQDSSWSEAINLGDNINSEHEDAYGSVTSDGQYLFFYRTLDQGNEGTLPNLDIYWVSAQFIKTLRSKQPKFNTNLIKFLPNSELCSMFNNKANLCRFSHSKSNKFNAVSRRRKSSQAPV
jgi:hypothetical protein